MSPDLGGAHLSRTVGALERLRADVPVLTAWGGELWERGRAGHRLLVAGNGGSAAQAQHLAAELVVRYREDRLALAAIALVVDAATSTAIVNDLGPDQLFARQVEAHGRPGDIALFLSTSGTSPNVVTAARVARRGRLETWALTGPRPNPLADAVDHAVAVDGDTATIQEVHQVAIHLVCEALEDRRTS